MEAPQPFPKARTGALSHDKPPKILICDDEQHMVRLLQVILEREGFEVVTASDGREGLSRFRSERPDLCVLDVMMPYVDGLELLRFIRSKPETEDIPVIVLTVKAQEEDVIEVYRQGADMYLTKPFNPTELVVFIRRLLGY